MELQSVLSKSNSAANIPYIDGMPMNNNNINGNGVNHNYNINTNMNMIMNGNHSNNNSDNNMTMTAAGVNQHNTLQIPLGRWSKGAGRSPSPAASDCSQDSMGLV
jgi:hypothetical protein